jgi:hypothetical protein
MRSSFFFLVARDKHAVWRGHAAHIHNPEKRLCGFLNGTGVPAPDRWESELPSSAIRLCRGCHFEN